MDFRHLIVTCLFSMLRLPFDNQKVKENYAIFFKKVLMLNIKTLRFFKKPEEFSKKTLIFFRRNNGNNKSFLFFLL